MARSDGDNAANPFPTFQLFKTKQANRKPIREVFARGWKRNRKRVGVFALALLAGHMAWNIWASATLNRELASLRAQGQPLRITEMAPPPIPDSQNGALVYLEAGRALNLTSDETNRIRTAVDAANDRTIAFDPGANPRDDALLARNVRAVALVRQATAMPECRFAVDYNAENLAGITLKHLATLRQLAELMRMQSAYDVRNAKADQALQDASAIFRISDALSREPIIISGVVAMVIQRIGYSALADVLMQSRLSSAGAAEAFRILPHADPRAMMARDFQAERTFGLWAYGYVSDKPWAVGYLQGSAIPDSEWYRALTRAALVVWSPWLKMDEVYYLRYMKETIGGAAVTPVVDGTLSELGENLSSVPKYAVISRIMSPTFSRALAKRDRCVVDRVLAEAAIAVNAYRTEKGRYPAALVDAMPGGTAPVDPYNDKPLHYRSEGGAFTLYSVGADRTDNDGKAAHDKDNTGDIVWPGV